MKSLIFFNRKRLVGALAMVSVALSFQVFAGSEIPVADKTAQKNIESLERTLEDTSADLGSGLSQAITNQTSAFDASMEVSKVAIVEAIRGLPLVQGKYENAVRKDPLIAPPSPVSCLRVSAIDVQRQLNVKSGAIKQKLSDVGVSHHQVVNDTQGDKRAIDIQSGVVIGAGNEKGIIEVNGLVGSKGIEHKPGEDDVKQLTGFNAIINPYPSTVSDRTSAGAAGPETKAKAVLFNSRMKLASDIASSVFSEDMAAIPVDEQIREWLDKHNGVVDREMTTITASGLRNLKNTWRRNSIEWIKFTEADASQQDLQIDENMMTAQMLENQEALLKAVEQLVIVNALMYAQLTENGSKGILDN